VRAKGYRGEDGFAATLAPHESLTGRGFDKVSAFGETRRVHV
jgi:hypothetical protein